MSIQISPPPPLPPPPRMLPPQATSGGSSDTLTILAGILVVAGVAGLVATAVHYVRKPSDRI